MATTGWWSTANQGVARSLDTLPTMPYTLDMTTVATIVGPRIATIVASLPEPTPEVDEDAYWDAKAEEAEDQALLAAHRSMVFVPGLGWA